MSTFKVDYIDGDQVVHTSTDNIDESDIAIADGNIMVGNASGVGAEVTMSGDATIINDGTLTLSVPKMVIYQETFAFGDMTDGGATSGTFVLTHTIPAGSSFVGCQIHALTGFTGDTSATLTVGDGTDVDRYNTGTPNVFVTAAAGVDMGDPSGTTWHSAAISTVTCTVTSATDFTAVSAGQVTVSLWYLRPV